MELMTLDAAFQPVKILENFESLVWSERYSNAGDFEFVSADIENTINTLPLESYVTLRESTVPMVVEQHKIRKPLRDKATITVTGRSFETVLERRASVFSLPAAATRGVWTVAADKRSDAAYKAIRTVIGDVIRMAPGGGQALAAIPPQASTLDAIPQINLPLPADYSLGLTTPYEIQPGDLYSTVIEMIAEDHHGIKAVRPASSAKNTVDIEIYNGADLTATVIFDARFDQFDDATYLLSKTASTNIAYVYGPNGSQAVRKNTVGPEVSGLDRRVLLVDEQSDTSNAALNSTTLRTSRGLVELYKYNATALFDGETSVQVTAGYNTRYHLGDILKLNGEYGLSATVRVAEFIRTSDSSGEKAYPAFETVE